MMQSNRGSLIFLLTLLLVTVSHSAPYADKVVAQDGSGDYTTITAALSDLPMYTYRRTVIYIKDGIYEEKLRIEPHYVTLRGQSRDKTIIRYNQPRPAWQANPDPIGPAVINIHGDDCVLDTLTIENTQQDTGVHAFSVYGDATRTVIVNCNVLSQGGDTVSLWEYKNGMYYHANCRFQGAVDFVCPRGWCFIRDSAFRVTRRTAALWHAGGYNKDQKFVLRNCTFTGDMPYELGRHHYEAQFYLLDCRFSETMLDKPIYLVKYDDPSRNNPYLWGDRAYYYNCHRDGGDFDWFADNLGEAEDSPKPEQITPSWTFGGRWDPESEAPPKITQTGVDEESVFLTFNEPVTVRDTVILETASGKTLTLVSRRFTDIPTLEFYTESPLTQRDLRRSLKLTQGQILASVATAQERLVGSTLPLPVHVPWRNCLYQPKDWYGSDEAIRIADNVLLYQRDTKGWEKNLDMARPLTAEQKAQVIKDKKIPRSTIDNGATYTPMRYLAKVYAATGQDRYKQAFLAGLDYLLEAQYDNGGWPQFYPIRQGYYQHITYNDDAMINVMRLLKDVAQGLPEFEFVDQPHRQQAQQAIDKGLEIVLKTQVRVNGKLTVWCAQHDEKTFEPAKARAYELPSLSGQESVGIVRYLMAIDNPSPEIRQAIDSACAWFANSQVTGLRVTRDRNPSPGNRPDRIVVKDPNAPRLWARFYDISTNKPIFVDRDGIPRDDFNAISAERRDNYSYLGSYAENLLSKEYPAWKKKWETGN